MDYMRTSEGVLALPLKQHGDLFDLTKLAGGIPENLAWKFSIEILSALQYLHRKRCAHRDIKLENVIMNDDFNAELIDFGFAEVWERIDQVTLQQAGGWGTKGYLCPELDSANWVDGDEEDTVDLTKSDMFSFGVLLFTMVVGCPPFRRAIGADPYYKHFLSTDESASQAFW